MSARVKKRPLNPVLLLLAASVAVLVVVLLVWWVLSSRAPQPSGQVPDWITQELLPINPYSRPGEALEEVNGVVVHYVGNPGTTAQQNRSYFENLAQTG